jgi:hypothetical protein
MNNNMILSQPPSKIIRQYLLGLSPEVIKDRPTKTFVPTDWPSTYDKMPDLPNRIATVYHGPGITEASEMDGNLRVTHPSIQILLRDSDSPDSMWVKSSQIAAKMDEAHLVEVTFGENPTTKFVIHSCRPTCPPVPLGAERNENTSQGTQKVPREDAKQTRYLLSQNYVVTITEQEIT